MVVVSGGPGQGLQMQSGALRHWLAMRELPRYGATPVAERVVVDGNVITAAGVSAGIDMALVLAARSRFDSAREG